MSNRLAHERSPYLLQHKDNPVDWYPWGPEAFARAREEEKPVFLSIGYSTCHWCHVMERESFENAGVAEALNRGFVSIKVDREERPDVDDIYMSAVQTMTGSGGWPLSLFLTPDAKPFYGGTYFPPDDRYGRPGFLSLLEAIGSAWKTRRPELETSAGELLAHVSAASEGVPGGGTVGREALDAAFAEMSRQFDARNGGFGGAPKFPPAMRLELLLRRYLRTGEARAREMIETTLEKMAEGGMYDQVGGGFHRYSVDAHWLVPHFEKMLYDNAMLARIYLLAFRAFRNPEHARIARETLDYLLREMTPSGGGFFAAQDADSGGEEGTYYVWTPGQLEEALGEADAKIVAARFGVNASGNFEGGATVLSVVRSLPDLARDFGRTEEKIEAMLERARETLRALRSERVAPETDDKLLTDWTGLAISAFALAGQVLAEPRYEAAARDAAERVLERCRREGELLHRERGGEAGIPGFASDYANMIEALLDLYEATFEPRYFREALALQETFDRRFDDGRGGYALTTEAHDGLILRPRETVDGATPSSNSVAASNLLRLHAFTGDARFREKAEKIFSLFSTYLTRASAALPRMLCALDRAVHPSREIVLSGEIGRPDFEALRWAVSSDPSLDRVVAHADAAESLAALSPLVSGRAAGGGPARAFVCRDFACQLPTADAAELAASLHG
ncbi:MAG: thioredoxin domain-containing protein [Acidobacteriota bacterium]